MSFAHVHTQARADAKKWEQSAVEAGQLARDMQDSFSAQVAFTPRQGWVLSSVGWSAP